MISFLTRLGPAARHAGGIGLFLLLLGILVAVMIVNHLTLAPSMEAEALAVAGVFVVSMAIFTSLLYCVANRRRPVRGRFHDPFAGLLRISRARLAVGAFGVVACLLAPAGKWTTGYGLTFSLVLATSGAFLAALLLAYFEPFVREDDERRRE